MRLLLKHISGMRPKCHHKAFIPEQLRLLDKLGDYKTVPDVDTVKESGRYNHFTNSKSCL